MNPDLWQLLMAQRWAQIQEQTSMGIHAKQTTDNVAIGLTSCKDIFFIKASSKQRCILLFTSLSRSVSLLPVIRCISFKGVATILLAGDRTPWGEPGLMAEGSWSGSEWSAYREHRILISTIQETYCLWRHGIIWFQLHKALWAWNHICTYTYKTPPALLILK